ncbi:hypothetical protein J6590_054644 [Homalodisca vitripennis]|nr:hypothetical protein J6590_054644 [Homalodisca vitripennis]
MIRCSGCQHFQSRLCCYKAYKDKESETIPPLPVARDANSSRVVVVATRPIRIKKVRQFPHYPLLRMPTVSGRRWPTRIKKVRQFPHYRCSGCQSQDVVVYKDKKNTRFHHYPLLRMPTVSGRRWYVCYKAYKDKESETIPPLPVARDANSLELSLVVKRCRRTPKLTRSEQLNPHLRGLPIQGIHQVLRTLK